jgi:hypothetical protein
MTSENRNAFRLNLNDEERDHLDTLCETLSESIGIDVTRTWVIRELLKLASCSFDKVSNAEAMVLKEMERAITQYQRYDKPDMALRNAE